MPEAFNLGNFFTSLLPTLAGFMVGGPAGAAMGLEGTAATLAPIAAGVATGAAVAGAKGEDVLSGALMGGLGGYGGGNLGSAFGKMGAPAVVEAPSALANQAGGVGNVGAFTQYPGQIGGVPSATTSDLALSNIPPSTGQTGMANTVFNAALTPTPYSQGLGQMGKGIQQLASDPLGKGYDAFKAAGGSGYQLGAPLAMAGLAGLQPEPYDYAGDEAKRKAEENKYRDPITGKLNLSASSGLNLTGFAMGGQVDLNPSVGGGISDLYNRPEGATTQSISSDGYGMGRLDRLSQQGSLAKAGDMFYAQGGPVSFADGGDTGMNLDELPSLNVNTGESMSQNIDPTQLDTRPYDRRMEEYLKMAIPGFARDNEPRYTNAMTAMFDHVGGVKKQEPTSRPANAMNAMYEHLTKKSQGMAQGGYLNGAGDGMSDSIPATIEGKQPARLADGEFVVPADVVSHIGNGSSKAGSKRLYAMLDKVRHARTGNKKQGKQINPSKYMPA
jgi:hypothetical protein